jgi:hypothetical protein
VPPATGRRPRSARIHQDATEGRRGATRKHTERAEEDAGVGVGMLRSCRGSGCRRSRACRPRRRGSGSCCRLPGRHEDATDLAGAKTSRWCRSDRRSCRCREARTSIGWPRTVVSPSSQPYELCIVVPVASWQAPMQPNHVPCWTVIGELGVSVVPTGPVPRNLVSAAVTACSSRAGSCRGREEPDALVGLALLVRDVEAGDREGHRSLSPPAADLRVARVGATSRPASGSGRERPAGSWSPGRSSWRSRSGTG